MAFGATPLARAQDNALSRQEILFEIANTYRTVADEQYLNGDRVAAATSYRKANEAARKLNPESGLVAPSDIKLILDEIQYRRTLLDRGLSFWGFEYHLRPYNPVAMWRRFDDTTNQFGDRVSRISGDVEKLLQGNKEQVSTDIAALKTAEDRTVQQLQRQAAATNLRYAGLRRDMLQDRMNAIMTRQIAIAAERQSLDSQMTAASSALNKVLLDSVASYVGLPPNTAALVQGAASGEVSGVLSTAALSWVSSGGLSELGGDFGKIADAAQSAAAQYKEIRDKVGMVQDAANNSAELVRAIQSGNTAAALNAGAQLFDKLPPSTKRDITQALTDNKTIKSAVALARQGSELRTTVVGYVSRLPDLGQTLQGEVTKYLDTSQAEFDSRYAQALSAVVANATQAADRADALARIAQGWSITFVDEIVPSKSLVPVARALGSDCTTDLACRTALLDKLKAKGFAGPRVSVSTTGEVKVTGPQGDVVLTVNLTEIAERTVKRPLQIEKAKIESDAKAIAAKLSTAQAAATKAFLAAIPDIDFDRHIGPLLNQLTSQQQSSALQSMFPADADGSDLLTRSLASFSMGRDLKSMIDAKTSGSGPAPNPAPGGPAPQPPPAGGGGQNAGEQALLSAMAASGPYGAAAAAAIKVLASMEALSNLVDQANHLDNEDRGLTVELLHLAPMSGEIDRDESLAQIAQRVAETKADGAGRRGELYGASLREQGGAASALEAKIKSQLPLTYYLSELLRQEYDQLDRALALWNGDVGPQGRYLQSLLRTDPSKARLALDPDIKLYDWFSRSSEGERKDLDALNEHWARLQTLAKQICNDTGCSPDVGQIGQVDRSAAIALSAIRSDVIQVSVGAPTAIRFTLLPQHMDLPKVDRLRLVDVSAVVRNRKTGATTAPVNFRLKHSGLGYISVDGEGVREVLDASDETSLRYLPDDVGIDKLRDDLQNRWRSTDALRPLEGYPLFGLYELSVPSWFNPADQELEFIFYYQRPNKTIGAEATFYGKVLSCPQSRSPKMNASDVQLLIRKDSAGILRELDTAAGGPACTLKENSQP